jgi:hypothetical protein
MAEAQPGAIAFLVAPQQSVINPVVRLAWDPHCTSLRSNRPVTARVATRSSDNWSYWSKNHLPEASLLIDQRHTGTGR